jgi:pyruvate dehydrogenase E1 component
MLAQRYNVAADVWSATSYGELRREALAGERWNRLHPGQPERVAFVTQQLEPTEGPIVAVSDFMKAVPDLIARWIPRSFTVLGTDGYGRSDTRATLRRFFEIDAEQITGAVLSALALEGKIPPGEVTTALAELGIDPEAPDPALP